MHVSIAYLVIRDPRENAKKCSIEPSRGLLGFDFHEPRASARERPPFELPAGILLAIGAPELSPADRWRVGDGARVVVLDSTWARLERLGACLVEPCDLVRRSVPGDFRTAYPRRSKISPDPASGLATAEAVFVASLILGEPRLDVLASYYWREQFFTSNRTALGRFGWPPS
jgi:ribosome biogenesis protein Tsr3